MKRTEPQLLR